MELRVGDPQYDFQGTKKQSQPGKFKSSPESVTSNDAKWGKHFEDGIETIHDEASQGHRYSPNSQQPAGTQKGKKRPHRIDKGESDDAPDRSKNHPPKTTIQQGIIGIGKKTKGHKKYGPQKTFQESSIQPTANLLAELGYYKNWDSGSSQLVVSQPRASETAVPGIVGRDEQKSSGVVAAIIVVVLLVLGVWIWYEFFRKRMTGRRRDGKVKRRKSGRNAGLLWDEDAESILVVDDMALLSEID